MKVTVPRELVPIVEQIQRVPPDVALLICRMIRALAVGTPDEVERLSAIMCERPIDEDAIDEMATKILSHH
jgi:hypothetical protein